MKKLLFLLLFSSIAYSQVYEKTTAVGLDSSVTKPSAVAKYGWIYRGTDNHLYWRTLNGTRMLDSSASGSIDTTLIQKYRDTLTWDATKSDLYAANISYTDAEYTNVASALAYLLPPSPSAPTLLAPRNDSILTTTITPTYRWSSSPTATSYKIWVIKKPYGATDTLMNGISTTTDTFKVSSTLSDDSYYKWFVKAYNAGGRSSTSSTFYDSVNIPLLSAPTLTSPTAGQVIENSNTVSFSWSAVTNAASYSLQIEKYNGSSYVSYSTTSPSSNSSSVALIDGMYRWSVGTRNVAGQLGSQSSTRLFTDSLLNITSFTSTPTGGSKEYQVITSIAFTWSYDKTITGQTLTGTSLVVGDRSKTWTGSINSPTTFTLQGSDAGSTTSSSITFSSFYSKRWAGVSSQDSISDAQMFTDLTGVQATDQDWTTANYSPSNQYIYFCFPSSWGTATFTMDGFAHTNVKAWTRSHTNQSGGTLTYQFYRLNGDGKLTGTKSVDVIRVP